MFFKRLIAYFIDMLIVVVASSMLASISYLNPQLDKYNEIYESFEETAKEYNDKKIEMSEYQNKIKEYNYDLDRNSIVSSSISIILITIYFVIFQKYNNGQTLGKKLMKIKIESNASIGKYLIRSLILYNLGINLIKILFVLLLSKENYMLASNILYVGALIIETTIVIMVCTRKDNRGLHDLAAGTNVIEVKPNEIKEAVVKEIGDK